MATENEDYVTMSTYMELMGCSRAYAHKLAVAENIRVRQVPGLPPRYHRGDIEAIVARTFKVAGQAAPTPKLAGQAQRQPASV